MRIFKSKWFMKWANKQGIDDRSLKAAVEEINAGLVDARELKALKQLAKMLLSYNDVQLRKALEAGGIEEVM